MDFIRIILHLIVFLCVHCNVFAQCDYDEIPACQDSSNGIPAFHWIQNIEEGEIVKAKIFLQKQTTYSFRSCLPLQTGPLWMVLIRENGQICLSNAVNNYELRQEMTWFVKESAWYELAMKLEYGAGCCTIMVHSK